MSLSPERIAEIRAADLKRQIERLQAQLELAHEVANDLEWALSRLKQRRRTVFVRQTMLEATERLRAFREASREP